MIMPVKTSRRTLGVTFDSSGTASIRLWAPRAKAVALLRGQDDTPELLHQQPYGYWQLTTDTLREGDVYRFQIDGKTTVPDPASLDQSGGVHGPSRARTVEGFNWTDSAWVNPKLQDYIFYEIHTGTFSPAGTFQGIQEKLPYLRALGITAIEIMPVAQFPGDRNWGYDGVFPFAVQASYGGAEGLQKLVDACHAHGIAVVLDVVYNHFGPEGNCLPALGQYFTEKYKTPWGNAINFDDAGCDAVRNYFVENALMWFRDFHIDALRLDAVHAIRDFSPKHILRAIREHVEQLMIETGRQYYLIVELDLNDTRFIDPLDRQGYGMDAQWVDEFHHALRVAAGQPATGYYSDFKGITHLAKSYRDAYVYDGMYSEHRQRSFGVKTNGHSGDRFVVFSQNHDQVGNRMLGERTSSLVSFEMLKLLAANTLVSPFLPLLFMGEEYAETNPFLYFVSHEDKALIEAVRKGRKAEFAAFHDEGEAPDPQASGTFQQSKLEWSRLQEPRHQTMFTFYQTLIAIRKRSAALRCTNRNQLTVTAQEETQTLRLDRWCDQEHALCLMNFSSVPQTMSLESDVRWRRVLDSADTEWGGPGSLAQTGDQVTLQPESFILYTR
ncbi:malto-oligosyltrehalose trehalohydrolase [Fulvivirgaceae bacterium PWU37]|uniref:Malto-oligosyltrehalose trehalohydrolase n=2 Tax=Dawidia soli TaxID=2782352 RepID=A0AAP2GIK8_9BACT|nr:malto-oligosyltrehalose trehalohydrolase [Dawidia soli]